MRRLLERADGWQRRHAVGGFPVAVFKKFSEDRASNLAALVAYYAFFSLFPLLLAFVSILGFVLDGNPDLRQDVVDSALARIPVIGPQLTGQLKPLTGSGMALAVGLIGALWAGLGVTVALGRAFADIWDVPRVEQPNGLKARAQGFVVLVILGVTLIASTVVAGLAIGGGIGPGAQRGAAVLAALASNGVIFLTVFAILTPERQGIRELLPGVALGAVGAFALQSLGSFYVDRAIKDASAVYGTFALVIGLLSWFLLIAYVLLIAAEVNVVLHWRLWPRSLTGELEPADRRALQRIAESARMDRRQEIDVGFSDDEGRRGQSRQG
jgi:YihY family inner membrane protein